MKTTLVPTHGSRGLSYSLAGYTNYRILINGTSIGSGSIYLLNSGVNMRNTGSVSVAVSGLTGQVATGKGILTPWGEFFGAERTFPNAINIEYQTASGNGGIIGNHQGWRLVNMNQWMESLKQAKQTSDFIRSDEG